jgi:alanine-synthesizing transaminase
MALDLLQQQKVLIVQGSGFNMPDTQHFRIVFLPRIDELEDAIGRLATFLKSYKQ